MRLGSYGDSNPPAFVGLVKDAFPLDVEDRVVEGDLSRNSFSSLSSTKSLDSFDVGSLPSRSTFPPEVLSGLLKNSLTLRPEVDDRPDLPDNGGMM